MNRLKVIVIYGLGVLLCMLNACRTKQPEPKFYDVHLMGQCISLYDGRPVPNCRIELLVSNDPGESLRYLWYKVQEVHYADSQGRYDFHTRFSDDQGHGLYFLLDTQQRKYYCQFNDVHLSLPSYNDKMFYQKFYPFKWSKVRFINKNKYQQNDTIYVKNNCQTDGTDYYYPYWSNTEAHIGCFIYGKRDTTIMYRGQYDDPTFLQLFEVKNNQRGKLLYQPFVDSRAGDTMYYEIEY